MARWMLHTCMLRIALNVSWRDHVNDEVLYGDPPWVAKKIRTHHLCMAGQCVWHDGLTVSNLVLWELAHGEASRGGQLLPFVDQLRQDVGLDSVAEIKSCMEDCKIWQAIAAWEDLTRWIDICLFCRCVTRRSSGYWQNTACSCSGWRSRCPILSGIGLWVWWDICWYRSQACPTALW